MAAAKPATAVLRRCKGRRFVSAAITPWGGFVMTPYVVTGMPGTEQSRWVIDPFALLKQALRLKISGPRCDHRERPPPAAGPCGWRRLSIQGRAAGHAFAGEMLRREILERYRIPHTVSVIEAEVSPKGLYPQWADQLEGIAKRIFAMPHVEIASHSYSHPYLWDRP
jgi:hypothetical protein